jgi:hypothetical protein
MLPFLIMFGGGVTSNTCLYSSFQSQTLSVVIGFSLIGKLSKIIMSSNIGAILPPKNGTYETHTQSRHKGSHDQA